MFPQLAYPTMAFLTEGLVSHCCHSTKRLAPYHHTDRRRTLSKRRILCSRDRRSCLAAGTKPISNRISSGEANGTWTAACTHCAPPHEGALRLHHLAKCATELFQCRAPQLLGLAPLKIAGARLTAEFSPCGAKLN